MWTTEKRTRVLYMNYRDNTIVQLRENITTLSMRIS